MYKFSNLKHCLCWGCWPSHQVTFASSVPRTKQTHTNKQQPPLSTCTVRSHISSFDGSDKNSVYSITLFHPLFFRRQRQRTHIYTHTRTQRTVRKMQWERGPDVRRTFENHSRVHRHFSRGRCQHVWKQYIVAYIQHTYIYHIHAYATTFAPRQGTLATSDSGYRTRILTIEHRPDILRHDSNKMFQLITMA